MNDYKELIAELRNFTVVGFNDDGFPIVRYPSELERNAADAIERLVKERDAAVKDLKVNANCTSCKYLNGEGLCVANWCYNGETWKWRGVQK